jgi:hypothetical protein
MIGHQGRGVGAGQDRAGGLAQKAGKAHPLRRGRQIHRQIDEAALLVFHPSSDESAAPGRPFDQPLLARQAVSAGDGGEVHAYPSRYLTLGGDLIAGLQLALGYRRLQRQGDPAIGGALQRFRPPQPGGGWIR